MKFIFELVKTGKYLRYAVIAVDEQGGRTTCGFLDLTEREAQLFHFALLEGIKSFQDGELQVEFTADSHTQAYMEGVSIYDQTSHL